MTFSVICNSKIPADIKSIARAESQCTWKCSLVVLQLGVLSSEMDFRGYQGLTISYTLFSPVLFVPVNSKKLALIWP